ncbi:GNAT family N-acetyltransferase [Mucilaginibacter celer]|uniref:GNAT family N-acetyltransferase n=1 Tax=Mucilaginibacter celer TaxID=2305508 RepID=A0A494VPT6_9SPHI|nr:GNAT family N-acetyltransferase [Mucilaginibacter celer]AYL95881.1 GNAT family N-acetyltransferase [Mucilaginibacter celer]
MVTENIIIKKLTLVDAETLLAFSRDTFFDFFAAANKPEDMEAYASTAFTLSKIEAELNNPDSCFFFAMLNDEIAGYLKLNYRSAQTEFRDPASLEVERIYVSRQHHGKKIGHRLLDFALNEASGQNLQYVWLGVWEHNQKAIGFYTRHGFEPFGSHEFLLGTDRQTDLLMKKSLN